MGKDVIIACDFSSTEETIRFLEQFGDRRPFVKVGMELFTTGGPAIIRRLKDRGHKVFVDLKFYDVPNTVERSMHALAEMDVDMTTIHASGSRKMMTAARRGLTTPDGRQPILLAITQLTSISQEALTNELLIDRPIEEVVTHYAQNAKASGLNGVVCSPLEAGLIHQVCGDEFLTVTPGIRFEDSVADDQARITTPAKANEIGSNYIVVGRPITKAENPVAAYERCMAEFCGK